ncbi:MAG TPA: aminodeoxychorismate/anthranilate synthase component II [Acidobacteriota bacterium]|jgi:anthranilate synthase/aminodeoxychorismate synthase-like glutamine amidotransferase
MTRNRILILDNYDSFTFNLVQLFGLLDQEVEVFRNDAIDVEGIRRRRPDALVISPGPGCPSEAGICNQAIDQLHSELPILGVCLGHQCIGEVFGGKIVRAPRLMHGKASPVLHDGSGILAGLPSPLQATRYHSLVVDPQSLPDLLRLDAQTEDKIIMALSHRNYPVFGIQFHPESVMTEQGERIILNFLSHCGTGNEFNG